MGKQHVEEGEQGVDAIEGGTAASLAEKEVLLLGGDETVEDAEVNPRSFALDAAQGGEGGTTEGG